MMKSDCSNSTSDRVVDNHPSADYCRSTSGRVLVIVKDSMSLAQLRDVLVVGIERVCDQRYRWFISQQAVEIRSSVRKQFQQQGNRRSAKRPGCSSAGAVGTRAQGHQQHHVDKAARSDDGSRRDFMYPNERELMDLTVSCVEESDLFGEYGLPNTWFASLSEENKLILIEVRFM